MAKQNSKRDLGVGKGIGKCAACNRPLPRRRLRRSMPDMPRQTKTCFIWFAADERPKLRKSDVKMSIVQENKELGRIWRALKAEQKAKYIAAQKEDQARYQQEMDAWQKKMQTAAVHVTLPADDPVLPALEPAPARPVRRRRATPKR